MSQRLVVSIDLDCCTGCGTCLEVCPAGAITLADGKAGVDDGTCTGCEACIDVCPEGAIHAVIGGELIPAPERSRPAVYQPGSLTTTLGSAVAAVGANLLLRLGRTLLRETGNQLARWLDGTEMAPQQFQDAGAGTPRPFGRRNGRGQRARHRQRRSREGDL